MKHLVKSLLLWLCIIGSWSVTPTVLAQTCPMPHEIEVAVNERLYECYYMVPGTEWRSEYIPLKCMHYYHYTPDVFRERLKTLKFDSISIWPGVRCTYVNAEGIRITLTHPGRVTRVHREVLRPGPPQDIFDSTFDIVNEEMVLPPELPRRICCCVLQ